MRIRTEIENGEGEHILVFDGHVQTLEEIKVMQDLIAAAWNLENTIRIIFDAPSPAPKAKEG